MKLNLIYLALLALCGFDNNPDIKEILVLDKESNETVPFAGIISLNSHKSSYESDFDGIFKIENSGRNLNQILEISFGGYETIVISKKELLSLDTIFLHSPPSCMSLGSTGILPYKTIDFHINPNTYIFSLANTASPEVKEREINRLTEKLNRCNKENIDKLTVIIDADQNGQILSFRNLDYMFRLPLISPNGEKTPDPYPQLIRDLKLAVRKKVINKHFKPSELEPEFIIDEKSELVKYRITLDSPENQN